MISSKAQTEIFGLMIVVVLISLLLLFVVGYFVTNEPEDTRAQYVREQLSTNVIKSMLTTSAAGCVGLDYADLVIDSFRFTPRVTCGISTSSEIIDDVFPQFLNATIEQWGFDYAFYIVKGSPSQDYADASVSGFAYTNTPDACRNAVAIEPGEFFLPVEGDNIYIRLLLCEY